MNVNLKLNRIEAVGAVLVGILAVGCGIAFVYGISGIPSEEVAEFREHLHIKEMMVGVDLELVLTIGIFSLLMLKWPVFRPAFLVVVTFAGFWWLAVEAFVDASLSIPNPLYPDVLASVVVVGTLLLAFAWRPLMSQSTLANKPVQQTSTREDAGGRG